jgi:hypothetical protein
MEKSTDFIHARVIRKTKTPPEMDGVLFGALTGRLPAFQQ